MHFYLMVEASIGRKRSRERFWKKKIPSAECDCITKQVVWSFHSYDNFDVTVTLVTTNFHLSNTARAGRGSKVFHIVVTFDIAYA